LAFVSTGGKGDVVVVECLWRAVWERRMWARRIQDVRDRLLAIGKVPIAVEVVSRSR
jgi:hypothetical protein